MGSGLACSDCSAGIPKAIERFRCKHPPDFNGDKGLNFSQSLKTPAQTRTGFTTTVLELGSGLRGHISTKQQFGTGREDEYLIQLKLQRKYHAGCLEGTQQAQPNGSGLRKSSVLLCSGSHHQPSLPHVSSWIWSSQNLPLITQLKKITHVSSKTQSSPLIWMY